MPFFVEEKICCKIYKTNTDRETDHFTSFSPDKRYPFFVTKQGPTLFKNTCLPRPSILCVTHQMSRKNRNYLVGSALPYEMINHQMLTVGTSWYWVSMGRYWFVLGGNGSVEGSTG